MSNNKFNLRFLAKINNGILEYNKLEVHKRLGYYNGSEVEVIIKPVESKRSEQQNAYYWAVIIKEFHEWSGQPMDDCHAYLKQSILRRVIEVNGKKVEVVGSTARLNKKQFEDYLTKCRDILSDEFAINVPLPNDVDIDFYFAR